METKIKNLIENLTLGKEISLALKIGNLQCCDATDDLSVAAFLSHYSKEPLFLLIPEKISLLKYVSNPPIQFYDWWPKNKITSYPLDDFINISAQINLRKLNVYLSKEEHSYPLLKRFRKPLLGTLIMDN